MQQIVRTAKGIGGVYGKYKNWGSIYRLCEGGLEARPLENFNGLKCILRSSEALFSCMLQYIHTYLQVLLPSSFGGFRKVRCTWGLKFESQHKREAKKQADLNSTVQRNDSFREARLGSSKLACASARSTLCPFIQIPTDPKAKKLGIPEDFGACLPYKGVTYRVGDSEWWSLRV